MNVRQNHDRCPQSHIADVPTVVGYIEKKAAFDRSLGCFDGILGMTPVRIAKAFFEVPIFAHALLASTDDTPVGFAFYHFRFSSFKGCTSLWLDDLYVNSKARRGGAGLALMSMLLLKPPRTIAPTLAGLLTQKTHPAFLSTRR